MGPDLKNRPTEGRREAVVEGFSRFGAAGGAVGLPRERSALNTYMACYTSCNMRRHHCYTKWHLVAIFGALA
eukprot:5870297-Pleurochrysis_carterae.AAC.1